MGNIVLQFCAFDSAVAKVIQWGTQGSVGHVDIVLPSGELLGAQHEAGLGGKPAGVAVRPADYGKTSGMVNPVRVSLPCDDSVTKAAYEWALGKVGAPYDTRAIEGIALGEDWSSEGHFICSGLAAGMLTQPAPAFFEFPLARHWRIITPEQFLLVCSVFSNVVPA